MGPGQMAVEADIDQRQARQCRAHDIELARHGQVHLVEAHAADPGKMRVGQEHAATTGRALMADRHGIAAALQGKALLTGQGQAEIAGAVGCGDGWRGCRYQRFGKLADTALHQQATGQLDQIEGGNRSQPFGLLAFGRQPLRSAFRQRPVETLGVAFEQRLNRRRLRLPERRDRDRLVEPGEEQIAGEVFPLLQGALLRAEVTRALAIDRQHFVGQQAQVVLAVGVTDAVAQATVVLGQNVRHTE